MSLRESFPPSPLRLAAPVPGRPDVAAAKWLWRASLAAYKRRRGLEEDLVAWGAAPQQVHSLELRCSWIRLDAFVAELPEAVLVAFRGTDPLELRDWIADSLARLVPGPLGDVHQGFLRILDSRHGADVVEVALHAAQAGQPIWLTGHSLGGALAVLCAARLVERRHTERVAGVYTYGQPRVGDEAFAAAYDAALRDLTHRFVCGDDLVADLPPRELPEEMRAVGDHFEVHRYRHVGREHRLRAPPPELPAPGIQNPRFDMRIERALFDALRRYPEHAERVRSLRDHMRLAYHEQLWSLETLDDP